MEKCYSFKMQGFCKTSGFGSIRCNQPEDLDWIPVKYIVSQAKDIVPLITSLILNVDLTSITITPTTLFISYLVSMKLIAIFIIICR